MADAPDPSEVLIEAVHPVDDAARGDVAVLGAARFGASGADGIDDAFRRDLQRPSAVSTLFRARARRDAAVLGAAYLAATESNAQGGVATDGSGTAGTDARARVPMILRVLVQPGATRPVAVAGRLVQAARARARELGAGHVVLWVFGHDPAVDEAAEQAGFERDRTLLQMKVPLPLSQSSSFPAGLELRAFGPGRDEEAWLWVNNRAFAGHEEQGSWTPAMLRAREAETWFDPGGLLLAFEGTELAGSCWTRVHPDEPGGPVGEIFVIGVEPDHQGRGLGRALTVAGLEHLHQRGCRTGMLYVDAANIPAVALYRSIGFRSRREDRAYVWTPEVKP